MNASNQLAQQQNAEGQVDYLMYHNGEQWTIVEDQADLDQAYAFALARSETCPSVVPSLVEGQSPQIIFVIRLTTDTKREGEDRAQKKAGAGKKIGKEKKIKKKAMIRQGREAFNKALRELGIPTPELNEDQHIVIDKMDIDSDGSIDLDDKKGKKKRVAGKRQIPWHRMMKALKRLGYDDSGDFDQA